MNIFATSKWPIQAAQDLDDKRVVKMIKESAQMLSTAVRTIYKNALPLPFKSCQEAYNVLYKQCYQNHPCNLWLIEGSHSQCFSEGVGNVAHLKWLIDHVEELCKIYENVYGREHKSKVVINAVKELLPFEGKVAPPSYFADCTEYQDRFEWTVHQRYRRFMILKWEMRDKRLPTWNGRDIPEWYTYWKMTKEL